MEGTEEDDCRGHHWRKKTGITDDIGHQRVMWWLSSEKLLFFSSMKEEGEGCIRSHEIYFSSSSRVDVLADLPFSFLCPLLRRKREEDPGSRFGLKRKLLRCLNLNRDPEEEVYWVWRREVKRIWGDEEGKTGRDTEGGHQDKRRKKEEDGSLLGFFSPVPPQLDSESSAASDWREKEGWREGWHPKTRQGMVPHQRFFVICSWIPLLLRLFSFLHPSLIHSFPPASLPTSCMMMMLLVFCVLGKRLNLNRKPLFLPHEKRQREKGRQRQERRQRLYMVDSFKSYCLHLHPFILSLCLYLWSLFLGMLYCSLPEELQSQVLSLVWFPSLSFSFSSTEMRVWSSSCFSHRGILILIIHALYTSLSCVKREREKEREEKEKKKEREKKKKIEKISSGNETSVEIECHRDLSRNYTWIGHWRHSLFMRSHSRHPNVLTRNQKHVEGSFTGNCDEVAEETQKEWMANILFLSFSLIPFALPSFFSPKFRVQNLVPLKQSPGSFQIPIQCLFTGKEAELFMTEAWESKADG